MMALLLPTSRNQGFTLIELIVVIAIIAILSVLIGFSIIEMINRGNVAKAQGDLNTIAKAIRLLEVDTGKNPSGINISPCISPTSLLFAIADSPPDEVGILAGDPSLFPRWKGPYLDEIPRDPWDKPYYYSGNYQCEGTTKGCEKVGSVVTRAVFSTGPDRSNPAIPDTNNIVVVLCHE